MNKVSGLLKIALLSLSKVFTFATSRNSVGNISVRHCHGETWT